MDVRDLAERARIRPPEPRRGREATFARNYRRFSTVLLAIMVPLELYLLTVAPLVVVLLLMGCTFALITMIGRGWEFLGRERSVAVEAASDNRQRALRQGRRLKGVVALAGLLLLLGGLGWSARPT